MADDEYKRPARAADDFAAIAAKMKENEAEAEKARKGKEEPSTEYTGE